MPEKNWDRVPIDAQSVDAPLSRAAIFLVVTLAGDQGALAKVCAVLNGLDDLVKTVGFRDLPARLSCVVGIGCDLWDHLNFNSRPKELRPFAPIKGPVHAAPSTPGDLLFHIRSDRPDLCFEFERLLLGGLGTAVNVVDEVSGFRYFDARDLLGFVDGTANPTGLDLAASALVGNEDPDFIGGSYVVVQKYLHDLGAWAKVPTPLQEKIIGRTKIDNVEIEDDDAPRKSHKGYSRYLWVIEQMLQRMYIGDPPSAYDRLLDFSTPRTGTTFFAPSGPTLKSLAPAAQQRLKSTPTRN
jgi:putative iron-dependent peroxidase